MPPNKLATPFPKKADAPGAPAWVLTFADLMSLLLAFFVLLFSFSEIDKQKFKELAGSLRNAFGVQREIRATDTPIGTNIIAREFSPNITTPSLDEQVRQQAMRDAMSMEDMQKLKDFLEDLEKINAQLAEEVDKGLVEIEDDGRQVVTIRIREKGSFPSGSASLTRSFEPVIQKISKVVKEIEQGNVVVAGHSDNLPIKTKRFPSNWDLSSARAATVLHRIVDASGEPRSRFSVAGHADTQPIDDNKTAAGRARNRRVEVILLRGASHVPSDGSAAPSS